MPRSHHASFPFVIVSGYGTDRQKCYAGDHWLPDRQARYRSLEVAQRVAMLAGFRRKRLAIVRDFGTKRERIVWERNK